MKYPLNDPVSDILRRLEVFFERQAQPQPETGIFSTGLTN